jgi:hypothetical protein
MRCWSGLSPSSSVNGVQHRHHEPETPEKQSLAQEIRLPRGDKRMPIGYVRAGMGNFPSTTKEKQTYPPLP